MNQQSVTVPNIIIHFGNFPHTGPEMKSIVKNIKTLYHKIKSGTRGNAHDIAAQKTAKKNNFIELSDKLQQRGEEM